MNVMLKSLAALMLLGACGAVGATDQAAGHGNQASEATVAAVRDVATGQATGKRKHQHQQITVRVGKIEDIDGDGVAAARAVSARGVATGKVSTTRPGTTSTAKNDPLYDGGGNKGDNTLHQPKDK